MFALTQNEIGVFDLQARTLARKVVEWHPDVGDVLLQSRVGLLEEMSNLHGKAQPLSHRLLGDDTRLQGCVFSSTK